MIALQEEEAKMLLAEMPKFLGPLMEQKSLKEIRGRRESNACVRVLNYVCFVPSVCIYIYICIERERERERERAVIREVTSQLSI
jgi:hypothetical protein